MTSQQINTEKGPINVYELPNGSIKTPNILLEILFETNSDTFAVNKSCFNDDFFDLKTGVAGEILQKISNYRLRLIIMGDYTTITSKSFHDLIYESNKNGKVIFSEDLGAGVKFLQ